MMKWMKVLIMVVAVLLLQACDKEVVCEDNTYYKEGDRCIRKALNTVDFVVPEGMDEIESVDLYEGFFLNLPEVDVDFEYGWFTNDSYTTPFDANKGVIRDMTLYLHMEGSYTYNFYVGTEDEEDNLVMSLPYYSLPSDDEVYDVDIEGYDFVGWYTDPERTIEYTGNTDLFDENFELNLYGLFEISTFTVTFVVPEVMYDLDPIEVQYQDSFNKPILDIERNHTWYTDDTYETVYNFNTPVTKDTSIYLVLEDVEFYIAYHYGSSILEYQQFEEIEDITSHPEPERSGLVFVGWYMDNALTIPLEEGELVKDELHPVIHLYALFQIKQFRITYMINDEIFAYRDYYQNDVINPYLPSTTYQFDGWYNDAELTQRFTDIMMPGEDITVYGTMDYEVTDFDSLTELKANVAGTEVVRVEGTVIAYAQNMIYVSDGTTVMSVPIYDRMFYDFPKGMTISLIGQVQIWNGTLDMHQVLSALEVGMNDEFEWPVVESSVAELLPVHIDTIVASRYYITGILQKHDNELSLFDGEYVIKFYHPMDATARSILSQYVDQTVTLNLYYFDLQIFDGELINAIFGFDGTADDITVHDMSEQTYTVDFVVPDTMDPIDPMIVTHGEYINLPVIDTESRYGWFINDSLITAFDDSFPIVGDLTLYYSVLPDPIQITYVLDGQVTQVIEYFPGEDLDLYEPTLSYMEELDGWYTDVEMTTPYTGTFVPYDSLTLYGQITLPTPKAHFTSIQGFRSSIYNYSDYISFEGIVVYNDIELMFVTDGDVNVLVTSNTLDAFTVEAGDRVIVYGNMLVNYSHTEFHTYGVDVVSSDNAIPLQPIEMTFEEFIAADTSRLEMQLFSITDTIIGGEYPRFLSDDSLHVMIFHAYSAQAQAISAQMSELNGQIVTVTLIFLGDYGREIVNYDAIPIAIGDVIEPEIIEVTYIVDDEIVHVDEFYVDEYMNLYEPPNALDMFDGWYTDATLETPYEEVYAPDEDITLYGTNDLPEPVVYFTSIQDYFDSEYTEEDYVSIELIVTLIDRYNVIATDGVDQLVIQKSPLDYDDVVVGDKIEVHGTINGSELPFAYMFTYYYEILSNDNPNPLVSADVTYTEFVDETNGYTTQYLQYFTITDVIHAADENNYRPYFGNTDEFGSVMRLHVPSGEDDTLIHTLNALDGQYVTIEVLYVSFYNYTGTPEYTAIIVSDEITITPDMTTITYVINGEVVKEMKDVPGNLFTAYTPWVSEASTFDGWYTDEALTERYYGLNVPEDDITLYGSLDDPEPIAGFSSLDDFNLSGLTDEDFVTFEGIVTVSSDGIVFISDGTNHISVTMQTEDNLLEQGAQVVLYGYVNVYENHTIITALFYDILSYDNDIPITPTVTSLDDFIALGYEGTEMFYEVYTITGTIHASDDMVPDPHFGSIEDGYVMRITAGEFEEVLDALDGNTVTVTIIYTGRNQADIDYYYAILWSIDAVVWN
ncbi:InlB B-repeat-containing protein [Candidatus Xianfuyuplasma coldseepsis]|uniref:InlB B-repeat-containing protein n=1 Tax=Candidatus Xianfuyuplasma coldseepsis TaxID=2782163 RepID=A0A7L7KSD3_9MOLU|nr:InlB B-repeat-containing protein [Xianfuyuplasma coldseepsis]QMS85172.1 InlB B-repeat-containing protein [Xianfuyuplasma coldseepsis]